MGEEILVNRHARAKKYNIIQINKVEFVVTHENFKDICPIKHKRAIILSTCIQIFM